MYNIDPTVIIRNPSYPLNKLERIDLESIIKFDERFKEAIQIASPLLSCCIEKYIKGELSLKETNKLFDSLYRYYVRMCSRCTPFGLFSSYSVKKIESSITTSNIIKDDRILFSTIDARVLKGILYILLKEHSIKNSVIYYANNSLYHSNNYYHYIETNNSIDNNQYNYSQISYSTEIEYIITHARKGIKLRDIRTYLFELEYTQDEIENYIDELIDNAVIVPEWELCITKQDLLQRIMSVLLQIDGYADLKKLLTFYVEKEYSHFSFSQEDVEHCSFLINNTPALKTIIPDCPPFNIIQKRDFQHNISLPQDAINEIIDGIEFLSSITPQTSNPILEDFKKSFLNRYGERSVPLLEALDFKIGIQYPDCHPNSTGGKKIIDNIHKIAIDNHIIIEDETIFRILFDKILFAIKEELDEISITKKDFPNRKENSKRPPSFSLLTEILKENNNLIYHFRSAGSISANCLPARFGFMDSVIENKMLQIAKYEDDVTENKIIAELVFAPEIKAANILQRPNVRKYQIICNANIPQEKIENAIFLSDLDLSIKNGKLNLYSKRLKKFIIPYNSTAHNYRTSKYPAYLLLSDIQTEYYHNSIFININNMRNFFDYIPRFRYKKCILSTASWKIYTSEILNIIDSEEKDEKKLNKLRSWRVTKHIPSRVLYSDGSDNLLLIDWNSIDSIKAFLSIVKNINSVWVQEFLYDSYTSIVHDVSGNAYANEFLFTIYNDPK